MALDPHRIAILPFRVTAADTLLGEGIAELLASEFTGESGPRAAHMGVVIRAWRQAGGGARASLTPPVASRLARQLGAGFYVDGGIVGLGGRLTVTASVVSVTDGESRRAEPIRGSNDSLDVLVGRLTTTLLALAGGESREGSRGVLTASPAAMRAYVEGMSAWRRYRTTEATAAFERAFREDSTFARAALMRFWIANWFGEPVSRQWGLTLFALRGRLSTADRVLVQSLLGDHYPTPRAPPESFGDRERAAAQLPESPEAQYLAGDWLFHYSGAIDATDGLERSRGYFARSFALDSQQTVLGHLVDVAVMLADTALLRSLQPALETRSGDMQVPNWLAAGYLGDRAWLGRLRAGHGDPGVAMMESVALLPAVVSDEIPGRVPNSAFLAQAGVRAAILDAQGRPEAARRALANQPGAMDFGAVFGSMVGDRDSASGAEAVRQMAALVIPDSNGAANRDCAIALWHEWMAEGATASFVPSSMASLSCTTMLDLVRAWHARAPDLAVRLESADSLVRRHISPSQFQGYENVVLARIWEAQGNRRRALSAIRLYPLGGFAGLGAYRLREEGRLAASVGQIDRAIEAYRRYLDMRKDAEPVMIPQRDSVRAAMGRLIRQ